MSGTPRLARLLDHISPPSALRVATHSSSALPSKVCVIIGCGTGLGSAIARKFAASGFIIVATRRRPEDLRALGDELAETGCHCMALDARVEEQVNALFTYVEQNIGPVHVCIFNIGANVRFSLLDTTARVFRKVWEMACFSAFLVAKAAAKAMLERSCGTILFTGASASLRGKAQYHAFGSAKAALRSLAQSIARELGPRGIHVAHVVVDGAIDSEFIRGAIHTGVLPENERQRLERTEDALLSPAAVAEAFLQLHQQHRSAWTQELDLRPYCESF
jgi:NAD(P)-dependent dehydrogenase (short-subunit alcohol dehydrogenase family)